MEKSKPFDSIKKKLFPQKSIRGRAARLAIKIIRSILKPKVFFQEIKNSRRTARLHKTRIEKITADNSLPHFPLFTLNGKKIRESILKPASHSLAQGRDRNVSRPGRQPGIKFSLIILNKNAPQYIIPLLESLKGSGLNNYHQVIVGDTGTTDRRVLEFFNKNETNFKIIKNLKYHFCKNYNYLVSNCARGELIGIMNNDIVLPGTSFLQEIENVFNDEEVGIVGTKLFYEDGRLQHGGMFFMETGKHRGLPYHRLHGGASKNLPAVKSEIIPAVTGAFMFCRRNDFIFFTGFDENYEEEAQDADLCLRFTRYGKKIVFLHANNIIHIENGTRPKGSENWKDRNYFSWKWNSFLESSILGTDLNRDQWRKDTFE
jgi:GT2 family glycosyltransferase